MKVFNLEYLGDDAKECKDLYHYVILRRLGGVCDLLVVRLDIMDHQTYEINNPFEPINKVILTHCSETIDEVDDSSEVTTLVITSMSKYGRYC